MAEQIVQQRIKNSDGTYTDLIPNTTKLVQNVDIFQDSSVEVGGISLYRYKTIYTNVNGLEVGSSDDFTQIPNVEIDLGEKIRVWVQIADANSSSVNYQKCIEFSLNSYGSGNVVDSLVRVANFGAGDFKLVAVLVYFKTDSNGNLYAQGRAKDFNSSISIWQPTSVRIFKIEKEV